VDGCLHERHPKRSAACHQTAFNRYNRSCAELILSTFFRSREQGTFAIIIKMKMDFSGFLHAVLNRPRLLASLLGFFTLLVFLPASSYDFTNWDDNYYIYENPLVLGGLSLRGMQYALMPNNSNWAPLTILSLQLDATLFGPGPAGFHFTNILLHSAAVALLSVALARMTGCPGLSAAATLIFAVHPLRVESVAWVSERKDVLCVFFLAWSLLAYERYCRSPSLRRYLWVATAMLGGLLSKATLVTLPMLLLILDAWPLGRIIMPGPDGPSRCDGVSSPFPSRSWLMLLAEKIPLFGISLIISVITLQTQTKAIAADMPFWEARLPNAVYAIAMYGLTSFYPVSLQPVYLHPVDSGRPLGLMLGCAAAIIVSIGLAVISARRVPAVPMGLAWFMVSLLPVLGVVAQQGLQSHADRFTYVPHVGLCVAVVWGIAGLANWLSPPRWALPTVFTVVVATFVTLDQLQLPHWRNSISLWSHAVAIDPNNPLAHCNLANALRDLGQLNAAESHYHQALETRQPLEADPAWISARGNLAALLVARGKIAEARQHLEKCRDPTQRDTEPLLELSLFLLGAGKVAEAAEATREAIVIDPTDSKAHVMHGRVMASQGFIGPAIVAYERALQFDPENIKICNDLATLLALQKRFDEAIPLYRSIIERDPGAEVPRRNLTRALKEQALQSQQKSRSEP